MPDFSSIYKHCKPLKVPFTGVPEELRFTPPSFDLETWQEELEEEKRKINNVTPEIFDGFLDGAQRTVLWEVLETPQGPRVPVYAAHIMVGIMWRGPDRKPILGSTISRHLIVAPFKGMGIEPEEIVQNNLQEVDLEKENPKLFLQSGRWMVCDITKPFQTSNPSSDRLLTGEQLWHEHKIRTRAMGRVALIRQYMELSLIMALRAAQPDAPEWLKELYKICPIELPVWTNNPFIWVDGPILLTARRRNKLKSLLPSTPSGQEIESVIMGRAVGVVKSHRLRPKKLPEILNLKEGERSTAKHLYREVDIRGQSIKDDMDEDDATYPTPHITCYLRLYEEPARGSVYGLVRLDIHRAALGGKGQDPLTNEERANLDRIASGVFRERLPIMLGKRNPVYPLDLLEQSMQASLTPPQVLHQMGK